MIDEHQLHSGPSASDVQMPVTYLGLDRPHWFRVCTHGALNSQGQWADAGLSRQTHEDLVLDMTKFRTATASTESRVYRILTSAKTSLQFTS
jgi:hypothetical protein